MISLTRALVAASLFAASTLLLIGSAAATPADAACAQPVSSGSEPTVRDCIQIARASIGAVSCSDCVCDTDGSGDVRIGDALRCLWFVVGGDVTLDCPPCESTTTSSTLPACAPCGEALIGIAKPDELCDSSRLLYDALKSCPCDQCADACRDVVCHSTDPAETDAPSGSPRLCLGCYVEQCRDEFQNCADD